MTNIMGKVKQREYAKCWQTMRHVECCHWWGDWFEVCEEKEVRGVVSMCWCGRVEKENGLSRVLCTSSVDNCIHSPLHILSLSRTHPIYRQSFVRLVRWFISHSVGNSLKAFCMFNSAQFTVLSHINNNECLQLYLQLLCRPSPRLLSTGNWQLCLICIFIIIIIMCIINNNSNSGNSKSQQTQQTVVSNDNKHMKSLHATACGIHSDECAKGFECRGPMSWERMNSRSCRLSPLSLSLCLCLCLACCLLQQFIIAPHNA